MNNTSPSNQEIDAERHEAIRNFGNVPFAPMSDEEKAHEFFECEKNYDEGRQFSTKLSDRQREIEMRNHE